MGSTIGGLPLFNVTDDSYYSIKECTFGYPNQLLQDIVFFSNRVENLAGQEIFNGHSGSFCYKGNNFSVMSINENSTSIGNTYFFTRNC